MAANALLIGLDSAVFPQVDALMARGIMPFLHTLTQEGVYAELRPVAPIRSGKTLVEIVQQAGLQSAVLDSASLRDCYPPELGDWLKRLAGDHPFDAAPAAAISDTLSDTVSDADPALVADVELERQARRGEQWRDLVRQLIANRPAACTAVFFDGPAAVAPVCWRSPADPPFADPSPDGARRSAACAAFYRHLDNLLADIAALTGPETTLVVASIRAAAIAPLPHTANAADLPPGILAARGPGIRCGRRAAALSALDVAPLLLYSLGLAVPADLEGRVPLELYEPAFRAKRQAPAAAPAASRPTLVPHPTATDSEATIRTRLRSLGYIE